MLPPKPHARTATLPLPAERAFCCPEPGRPQRSGEDEVEPLAVAPNRQATLSVAAEPG